MGAFLNQKMDSFNKNVTIESGMLTGKGSLYTFLMNPSQLWIKTSLPGSSIPGMRISGNGHGVRGHLKEVYNCYMKLKMQTFEDLCHLVTKWFLLTFLVLTLFIINNIALKKWNRLKTPIDSYLIANK